MSVTKLDLYKAEWLDLVFANKNKQYGAYYLRQHYASNMLKALCITFFSVGLAIAVYSAITKYITGPIVEEPPIIERTFVFTDLKPPLPDVVEPKLEQPKPQAPKTAPAKTTVIPVNVVEENKPTIEPPVMNDITGPISSVNTQGEDKGINIDPGIDTNTPGGSGSGTEKGSGTDDIVYAAAGGLSEMPEPVGGAQAWAKFLQKNLRYPAFAEDERISGRVLLSFIIEKDGQLSNITIDHKAGFGFDEEAMRVLKKAVAWKPGKQNGQPVRVKYVLPINFRLPE
jgi:protein TonB